MRLVKLFLPCAILLLAGSVLAGELSPKLELMLAEKQNDDPITVLVVMHERVDILALDQSLHDQRVDLADRHVTVIETLKAAARSAQADLTTSLEARRGTDVVSFTPHWLVNGVIVTGSEAAIREIAAREDVEIVEPNLVPEVIEPARRYEADSADRGIGITPGVVSIGARRVWDELGIRGEGALIGGLDTGVDGDHPAFADRWRGNHAPWQECWLDVVGSVSTFPNDQHFWSHGTHCMGTMCGVADDDTIGVAPAAEWIAANAIDQGAGGGFDIDIVTCFEWFADPDGDPQTMEDVPDVVQNSWGVHEGFGYPDCDSRWWDVIDGCEAAGPVVVFAAGNEGPGSQTLRSPGDRATTIYNMFTVGATNHTYPYNIASFSSRGPAGPNCGPEENRVKPEVSAPGVSIYSADNGGGYQYMDGTSMACPHVCGVVALMRSANPNLDVITIKQVLMDTSLDRGTPGEDNVYGHGFIDAYEAVFAVMGGFGTVEGTVTDRATGLPIPDAYIFVENSNQSTYSESDGSFSVFAPAGAQVISAAVFGYENFSQDVEVPEDGVANLLVRMTALPQATVSGTVFLPDGTPASEATIIVQDAPVATVIADPAGDYSVSLPAGSDYILNASAGSEGVLTVNVPFLADLELDLHLGSTLAEGYETGDLTGMDWIVGGYSDWYVQSSEVHTGDYAARSGVIPGSTFTQMQTYVDCGDGGDITFWHKTSSQANGDYLRFYIGNTQVGSWSGETEWTQSSFPTGSGTVSFRWRYQTDASGSAGQDCAWVDDIVFPGGGSTEPLIVAAPTIVAVEMATPGQIIAPGYLFNQGGGNLNWSLSESASWLNISPTSGVVAPGEYVALNFDFNAFGLPDGTHQATVTINSDDPANPTINVLARLVLGEGSVAVGDQTPAAFALLGAVPNPFNPMTTVRFSLPESRHAVLAVYDVRGQLVRTLVDGVSAAGVNEVRWDGLDHAGRAMASGTYFARLKSGDQIGVMPLTLVR